MPYRRARKTIRKKPFRRVASRAKTWSRRSKPRIASTKTLSYPGIGLPDQFFTKLRYVQTVQQTVAAGVPAVQRFQSSLFDPDFTGTGHQPSFFDQLTALYNQYQVLGMRYDIDIVNNSSTVAVSFTTLWSDDPTPALANQDAYSELKYARRVTIGQLGSGNVRKIKGYMSAKKIHGMRNVLQQDDQQSLVTTNPADVFFLYCVGNAIDSASSANYTLRVALTYYCRFFSQSMPSQS